jgi:hypothetical protein
MLDKNGNVISGREIDRDTIASGLEVLAREVLETWLAADYPPAIQSDTAQFRHALIHATKALGKIAALADHADHDHLNDDEAIGLRAELPKLLGDIIRCAAKMAEKAPGQPVVLWRAYTERADQLAQRWGHG